MATARVDRLPNNDPGWRVLDFIVYRSIRPINKATGRPITVADCGTREAFNQQNYINGFVPAVGDYLMDIGEPVFDEHGYAPLLTNMNGSGFTQGRVPYHCLQAIPFPWGLDNALPVQIYANRIFRDDNRLPFNAQGMSRRDLQWEAKRRRLDTGGTRAAIVQRIQAYNDRAGPSRPQDAEAVARFAGFCALRLFRVRVAQPAGGTEVEPLVALEVGEVVYSYGMTGALNRVRDIYGNRSLIPRANLEPIPAPFGLKLNQDAMHNHREGVARKMRDSDKEERDRRQVAINMAAAAATGGGE